MELGWCSLRKKGITLVRELGKLIAVSENDHLYTTGELAAQTKYQIFQYKNRQQMDYKSEHFNSASKTTCNHTK